MTSQGSAHGRFQRAIERGQLDQAEMAARELGQLSMIDALSLVVGYARAGEPEVRAGGRPVAQSTRARGSRVQLAEMQLATAALACLRGRCHERAEKTLLRLI